jgi:hypothetical protein
VYPKYVYRIEVVVFEMRVYSAEEADEKNTGIPFEEVVQEVEDEQQALDFAAKIVKTFGGSVTS